MNYGNIATPDITPYHHIISQLKVSPDETVLSQHPLTPAATVDDVTTLPRDQGHVIKSPSPTSSLLKPVVPQKPQIPESESTYSSPPSSGSSKSLASDSAMTTEPTISTDNIISHGEILNPIPRQYREIGRLVQSGHDISEGEWVLSPQSKLSAMDFVNDPDVRELLRQQINNTTDLMATLKPFRQVYPNDDDLYDEEEIYAIPEKDSTQPRSHKKPTVIRVQPSDLANETPRSSHPKPPIYRPLPTAPPNGAANHSPAATQETLELITPIPHSDSQVTDSLEHVEEFPSPPPFGGLDLEDYISEGEITYDSM